MRTSLAAFILAAALSGCVTDGITTSNSTGGSSSGGRDLPSLVVTNEPAPEVIYHRGSRDTVLSGGAGDDLSARVPRRLNDRVETLVTRKVAELSRELSQEQGAVSALRDRLSSLQAKNDGLASEYYAIVASINTELQAGTTAGNPILTDRWNAAQNKLEALSTGAGALNVLASDVSTEASKAAYLQESVRSTYGLSGAVADDHKKLQVLEDEVNQGIVGINRLLTSVNDEISRRTSYLRAERLNMQTLSLAVANGELYGQSMANGLYKKAAEDGQDFMKGNNPSGAAVPSGRRPLVVIRFDRSNVNFQQPVYTAVSQALDKYPGAKFDLVAVSPSEGNPAKLALASAESRKNGEAVLRALTQMGLPMERVRLNAANSRDVVNSEVHLYIQ